MAFLSASRLWRTKLQKRLVVSLDIWKYTNSFTARQPLRRTLLFLCLLIVLGEHALTEEIHRNTLSTTYPININLPQALAMGDLNEDGHPDLVVAAYCLTFPIYICQNGAVGVSLGNSDGTFQPMVTYSLPFSYPISVIVTDVNGDGHPDLIVGGWNAEVAVMLGNGDGTLRPAVVYQYTHSSLYAVADVNGDHFPDLFLGLCLNAN